MKLTKTDIIDIIISIIYVLSVIGIYLYIFWPWN